MLAVDKDLLQKRRAQDLGLAWIILTSHLGHGRAGVIVYLSGKTCKICRHTISCTVAHSVASVLDPSLLAIEIPGGTGP